MCGRYGLFTPPEDLESRFDATFRIDFEPTYNAAPSETLPIITDDQPGAFRGAEWGLIPSWADDPSEHGYINARAETLWKRASFREPAEQRRCLVPADGFYEWGTLAEERRPYFYRWAEGDPFAMAGLWERWGPETTQAELGAFSADDPPAEPDPVETFTIVTTPPNATIKPLHDRMPVILPRDREQEWLTADRETARKLLAPSPADGFRLDPVSRAVNDPTTDRPDLVAPIDG